MSGQCQGYGLRNILSKGQQGPLAKKGIILEEGDKTAKVIKMQDQEEKHPEKNMILSEVLFQQEEPSSYSHQLFSLDSYLYIIWSTQHASWNPSYPGNIPEVSS